MSTTHAERLRLEIAEIAQPLVDHYNEIDRDIRKLQAEIVELRKSREQLRKTIRSINPELIGEAKPGPRDRTKPHVWGISKERIASLGAWLQEHRGELNADGGFHSAGLERTYNGQLPIPQYGLNKALGALHEQGLIRLDHTGNGGSKYYKVV